MRPLRACLAVAVVVTAVGCQEREPEYEDAGERYDAAIKRVEDAKAELRAAEVELAEAQQALEQKVQTGPQTADEIVPPEDPN